MIIIRVANRSKDALLVFGQVLEPLAGGRGLRVALHGTHHPAALGELEG